MKRNWVNEKSRAYWKKLGYHVGLVERSIKGQNGPFKQDLFGFCDYVLVHPEKSGTVFLQVTSGTNHASRLKKILECQAAIDVLKAGNRVVLMSWRKNAKGRYEHRINEITLEIFSAA